MKLQPRNAQLVRREQPAHCHRVVCAHGGTSRTRRQRWLRKELDMPGICGSSASTAATSTASGRLPRNKPDIESGRSQMDELHLQLAELETLNSSLSRYGSCFESKVNFLRSQDKYLKFQAQHRKSPLWKAMGNLPYNQLYVILCLIFIGQEHILLLRPQDWTLALRELAVTLLRVETFYDCMGGLVGYQLKSIKLICLANGTLKKERDAVADTNEQVKFYKPPGVDLAGEEGRRLGVRLAAQGLMALPEMAEIYPVGGAGDRLGLKCNITGESLPAALLPFCGRTMFEGLMRDLQAREYLYFKLTGCKVTTPVAVMTSDAKGNHDRICSILERFNWFGRPAESFYVFRQPLVPVLNVEDGSWLLEGPLFPVLKPGGHGVIWKLMMDEGVFQWLEKQSKKAALIRQISNPIAGTDTTLLALSGTGYSNGHKFGFMSCERAVGAAEGMNVLQEKRTLEGGRWRRHYNVTNIEYTEFERLGISDEAADEGSPHSVFPANTNVLYANLKDTADALKRGIMSGGDHILPNLIFNLKKQVLYRDPFTGIERQVRAGRMECTMQNLADSLTDSFEGPWETQKTQTMSTFMLYNMRRKVTSSAKRRRAPGSNKIHQTPDGAFFDLMRNAWQIMQRCGLRYVPEVGTVEEFLEKGPSFLFFFHPALGPLWDIISQKINGGSMMEGSELVLEIAEARLQNVNIDGSLLIKAEEVMGDRHPRHNSNPPRFHHADQSWDLQGGVLKNEIPLSDQYCGRVMMSNVRIQNVGVDWHHPENCYWQNKVHRHEACTVVLHGSSEFEAFDVCIGGNRTFEIPDGYRLVVTSGIGGQLEEVMLPLSDHLPSWEWKYEMSDGGAVQLKYHCQGDGALTFGGMLSKRHADSYLDSVLVLDFVI